MPLIVVCLDGIPVVSAPTVPKWSWRCSELFALDRLVPSRVRHAEASSARNEAVALIVVLLNRVPVVDASHMLIVQNANANGVAFPSVVVF